MRERTLTGPGKRTEVTSAHYVPCRTEKDAPSAYGNGDRWHRCMLITLRRTAMAAVEVNRLKEKTMGTREDYQKLMETQLRKLRETIAASCGD